MDQIFYDGGAQRMHCSVDIDRRTHNDPSDIDAGLDRARDRGETIEIFGHIPGAGLSTDLFEHVLKGARDRGLNFVTYRELATGEPQGPSIAFAFDDSAVDAWLSVRDLMLRYGAKITFFVTRYMNFDADMRAAMHQFAADGHDIEAHTTNHLHAPEYVMDFGLDQYMSDEVMPSIDRLEADGFPRPVALAYPFGQRTSEIDDAVLEHVTIVRSVSYAWSGGIVSPCPL